MAVTTTNLGVITAYGDAVAAGYTGTKAEWQTLMASYATVGQQAVDAKNDAVAAKDIAVQKAADASAAAGTATQKANDASASAQSIAQSASQIAQNTSDISELKEEINTTFEHITSEGELAPSLWEYGYWNTTTGIAGVSYAFARSKGYIDNNIIQVTSENSGIGIAVLLYASNDSYVGWLKNNVISTESVDNVRTGFQTSIDLYKIRGKYPTYKLKLLFSRFDATNIQSIRDIIFNILIYPEISNDILLMDNQYHQITSDFMVNGLWENGSITNSNYRICTSQTFEVKKGDKIYLDTTNSNLYVGWGVFNSNTLLYWTYWKTFNQKCFDINYDGQLFIQARKIVEAIITPSEYDVDVRLYRGTQRIFAPTTASSQFTYIGEKIPSEVHGFNSETFFTMSYSGVSAQDIEIFDDYMFVAFSGDDLIRVYSMTSKALVASLDVDTQHGSGMQFSREYYTDDDTFPLLYVGGWTSNLINVIRITNASDTWGATIVRQLYIPTSKGYYLAPSVDANSNVLYCYGYKTSTLADPTNTMKLLKYDLSILTDNGDNTYTPALLSEVETPRLGIMQGRKYYKGNLYVGFANAGAPHNARLVVIDATTGDLKTDIDMTGVTTSENEGVCYQIVGNKIYWYYSDYYNVFKLSFD